MQTIYKYRINTSESSVDLPEGAEILSVGEQDNRVYLWARVDTDKPLVPRRIYVIGTGFSLDLGTEPRYVGTVHMPTGFVWHIYEGA